RAGPGFHVDPSTLPAASERRPLTQLRVARSELVDDLVPALPGTAQGERGLEASTEIALVAGEFANTRRVARGLAIPHHRPPAVATGVETLGASLAQDSMRGLGLGAVLGQHDGD